MNSPKPRTIRYTSVRKSPASPEARANRLKAIVVVLACVLGIALGIGCATLGRVLFASAEPAPGRTVSLGELQKILEVQAEAALSGGGKSEAGSPK